MYKVSRINYVNKVLERQQQIISYLKLYQQTIKQKQQPHSQTKKIKQKPFQQLSPKVRHGGHSLLESSQTMNQVNKLINVNEIMLSISVNLHEITQKLQQICTTIAQSAHFYELSKNTYLNKFPTLSSRITYPAYNEGYHLKIYQDLYFYIHNCFFVDSFREILNKPSKQIAVYLLEVQTKLSMLPVLSHGLQSFQPDITVFYPNDLSYSYVWKNVKFMNQKYDKFKIEKQMENFRRVLMATTAAIVTEHNAINLSLIRKMIFGVSFPIFLLADDESHLRCYRIWRNPMIENVNKIWNLPESGIFLHGQHFLFSSIKTSFFIYVPIDYAQNSQENRSSNIKNIKFQAQQLPPIYMNKKEEQAIRVLVLCHQKLIFNENLRKQTCRPFSYNLNSVPSHETIMIFMAGGGFVSLSSETAQIFTRKWANSLQIPIFSIDYRKAPKYRYPSAIEDCLTAYMFIIQKIDKYFNVKPKNVILAGDSSGGNLAIALYALLLQKKYPILPTGMFLAYPAADLRVKFSPSRVNAFRQPILMPTLLMLCINEYLGEDRIHQSHPFASPLLLSQYFIKTGKLPPPEAQKDQTQWPRNWPKTTIMVGKKDPLYDDSLRLLQRMCQVGVDAKLLIYNQFSHAFLGMGTMISECNSAIYDSIQQISKLMQK